MAAITLSIPSLEALFYFYLFTYKIEFFTAFVGIFVGRKVIRATAGGKYTRSGLVISPLMYLAFTASTFIDLNLVGLLVCAVFFAIGIGLSGPLRGQLKFFEKNGQLYYRRSIWVTMGWTVAFVLRLYMLIFFDITVGLILSAILSYITGLIIGEAFQIAVQKRMFDFKKKHLEERKELKDELDVF
ncbi:MAG: hypothetical protein M1129_05585 [Candidatus Thermoplasmatota archaeon]|jgi:hypothetical protein|nr:hypothetical protein [Candidatus Thermoplasmatota archaeon]MCL5955738.1 hypothetical protein [Candidatus Thermoplasmatota archaeon]